MEWYCIRYRIYVNYPALIVIDASLYQNMPYFLRPSLTSQLTDTAMRLQSKGSNSARCQIKSNHFYCHITTAQVPWWVKFLWACSRQCRKTTDHLHMDRQCKKTTDNLHIDRQCKKTTDNLHMDIQCKKLHWSIYSAPDSAKKQQQQFTYGQTVQKNNKLFTYGQTVQKTALEHLQCSRQCKKTTTAIYIWTDSAKKATAIYIWTVHITDCTEDNVQNTHTYTQYT